MAFNRAKFNHLPFNTQSDMVKWLSVSALEEVDAVIGSALNFYPLAIGYERVDEVAEGMKGKFISAAGTETIDELVAEGQLTVILFPHFEETVTETMTLGADIRPMVSGNENIISNVSLGADIYTKSEADEIVDAVTSVGANIYPDAAGYELVSESASLENIEFKVCYLNLTLRPGQVLIVDANTYNVLLDNENAIDTHSGEWIDDMNRSTTDITIEAASGSSNLSATVLYTERYL